MRQDLILSVGFPNEMQVREMILAECERLGGKAAFCRKVGISVRYLDLIMEWRRAPVHYKLLAYFGWPAVYAVPEDIPMLKARRQNSGQKPSIRVIDADQQRLYWRTKQRESRARRRRGEGQ